MSKKVEVVKECDDCGGTGLYVGFAERKGEAVVCLRCNGTGAVLISYTPFAGRKKRKGVKQIRVSAGSLIATGIGGKGQAMTYEEFEKKYQ